MDGAFLRTFDARVVNLMTDFGADLSRLDEVPMAAALLRSDAGIRTWLIEHGIDIVELPATSVWVDVRGTSETAAWSSSRPVGRSKKLVELVAEDRNFANRLVSGSATNTEVMVVRQAVSAILQPGRLPARDTLVAIQALVPLMAERAYQAGTRATMLVDALRSSIADKRNSESSRNALRLYWIATMLAGQMFLLASEKRSRNWLLDMSATLEWRRWTPSLSLVRARSAWLCAVAARGAAAFGSAIVDQYAEKLGSATTSMEAFDAVFGLTAIGVAEPSQASAIESVLISALKPGARLAIGSHIVAMFVSSGLSALSHQDTRFIEAVHRRLGWGGSSGRGLATASALKSDALQLDSMGFVAAFATIGAGITAEIPDFFPSVWTPAKARTVGLTDAELRALQGDVAPIF